MQLNCKQILTSFVLLVPFAIFAVIGAAFLTSPLREMREPQWTAVADLSSLPPDGQPTRVPVFQSHSDAWSRLPDQLRGHVFLRRMPGRGSIVALKGEHHDMFHIPVRFDAQSQCFRSTCWLVRFDLDGREIHENASPLGEDLQTLDTRIVEGRIFVRY